MKLLIIILWVLMNEKLELYLQKIIQKRFGIHLVNIQLSVPPKKDLWDFAFGGFQLSKHLQKDPNYIVAELQSIISEDEESVVESSSIEGPYLNMFLSGDSFFVDFINSQKEKKTPKRKETIFIDYIGANVWKPLHIGHMCTPNIGQALINAYRRLWYNIISDSHIGDWGIIFGKLITGYQRHGKEEELERDAINHLYQLYVRVSAQAGEDETLDQVFRDTFKKLSQWDPEMLDLWLKITKSSIKSTYKQLSRMNVRADYDIGESFYEGIGLPKLWDYPDITYDMKETVEELIEKGIATRNDDGSVGVSFRRHFKLPSCILQKRDGTHGYLASDLAAVRYRMENWDPEKILYCVDVRQQLHMKQTYVIAELAWWTTRKDGTQAELKHIHNGFISLKDGAMSTREGRIIQLDGLLDESEKRARDIILEKRSDIEWEELDELTRIIGIGAIKYGYLKKSRELDMVFDWDEFMTFEGNSWPYIQYSYVRAKNILRKSDETIDSDLCNTTHLSSNFVSLMTELSQYEEVLEKMLLTYHPHVLCAYAYSLAKAFNTFYNGESILGEENDWYRQSKLYLVQQYTIILHDVFDVLGIELPEKM